MRVDGFLSSFLATFFGVAGATSLPPFFIINKVDYPSKMIESKNFNKKKLSSKWVVYYSQSIGKGAFSCAYIAKPLPL
jgi:hypothetical protein